MMFSIKIAQYARGLLNQRKTKARGEAFLALASLRSARQHTKAYL